jgi:hypothetical protein
MATTRLGLLGVGVDAYAGFTPKGIIERTDEQFTRLTLAGIGGAKYAGFVAKEGAGRQRVTRLTLAGVGGARYAGFLAKAAAEQSAEADGTLLTAFAELVPGSATGDVVTPPVPAPSFVGGFPYPEARYPKDARARGARLTVNARLLSGAASGSANASGGLLLCTANLLAGDASASTVASGAVISITAAAEGFDAYAYDNDFLIAA